MLGAMKNQEILEIAMYQSACDVNCDVEDFFREDNIVVLSKVDENARRYLTLPFECNLVSYGNNIVASVREDLADIVWKYIQKYPVEHCFETPNMHVLNDALKEKGLRICFMAEYFLPDVEALKELPCKYELRVLHQEDFADLYLYCRNIADRESRQH